MSNEPIVKLEPGGKASVLSYNVPEPVSYTGTNVIVLDFPYDWFRQTPGVGTHLGEAPPSTKPKEIERSSMSQIVGHQKILAVAQDLRASASADETITSKVPPAIEKFAAQQASAGRMLVRVKTVLGSADIIASVPPVEVLRPRLFLREKYRLSSFLGQYGAGRTVKTFSLLPGEKTKISVTTYLKSTTSAKEASSVLDSVTETSATEFQQTVSDEESDKRNTQDSLEWHVEAQANANWGWGSAKVSGGVKGASAAQREQFAKQMSSATGKHAAAASAKRDVQVNTSYETTTESGESTSVERLIENINVSRTLNFVFRQMNQEFVTVLHLVDVEIGFFNGQAGSGRVVPLHRLRELVDEVIGDDPGPAPASRRDHVEAVIRQELNAVMNWKGEPANSQTGGFIDTAAPKDGAGQALEPYLRVNRGYVESYRNEATGFEVTVPGVITSVNTNVMRTEGIIVEALLGQGNGLDPYSEGLQRVAIRERELGNERLQAALGVLSDSNQDKAKIFATLFPQPPVSPVVTVQQKAP